MTFRLARALAFAVLFALLLKELSIAVVLIGIGIAWLIEAQFRSDSIWQLSPAKSVRMIRFLWDFAKDLTVSNIQMAWDVLTPQDLHQVSMVRVPVDDLNDSELTLLSHRITLTPGTLSCALAADTRHLIVHVMYPVSEDMPRALRRPIDILKGKE